MNEHRGRSHEIKPLQAGVSHEGTGIARARAPARARKPRVHRSYGVEATILARIAAGELLSKICSVPELPTRKTFFEWLAVDTALQHRYQLALELRVNQCLDETIAIADDSSRDIFIDKQGNVRVNHEVIARSKLKIEARMWHAAKITPKKYGGKFGGEFSVRPHLKPEEVSQRIAELLHKATCRKSL